MPQKRKSGYALSDDEDVDTFNGHIETTNKSSKRSKKATSTPPIQTASVAHFSDVPVSQSPKTDKDGTMYWEISKARRVTLSDYRDKKMVGIREYYEKDGQMLPGKKGISMTLEQFGVLVTLLPGIENALKKDGVTDVPRPDYDGVEDDAAAKGHTVGSSADKGGGTRANHEATSDEESD